MKTYAWLGVIGIGVVAAAACTVNSTTNNNGGTDGGEDTSTGSDGSGSSSGGSSSGGDSGTPTPDTGSGEGGGCTLAISTGSTTCDPCAQSHCCTEVNTCDQGPMDDAGLTKCEQLATSSCVKDCLMPPADSGVEAGTLMSCLDTCGPGAASTDIANATAVLNCFATNCATECSQ